MIDERLMRDHGSTIVVRRGRPGFEEQSLEVGRGSPILSPSSWKSSVLKDYGQCKMLFLIGCLFNDQQISREECRVK